MKAAQKAARVMPFDGIDDFVSIDGSSGAGNPYDFEYNQPITIAIGFLPQIPTVQRAFMKANLVTRKGYYFYLKPVTGTGRLAFNISYSTTQEIEAYSGPINYSAGFIGIGAYDGAGNFRMRIYNPSGSLLFNTFSISGAVQSISIKNTIPLTIGGTSDLVTPYKGLIYHPSIWNAYLSDTEMDDLALKMVSDKVNQHALYTSNCVGYWREYLPKVKLINAVNRTYDGTLNGGMV